MSAKAPARTKAARRRALDPDELAALEEERDFLLRSLEDLEAEHDAGDIDEDDYLALKDDYTARAAQALRAVDQRKASFKAAAPSRSKGSIVLVLVGVVAVAVLAGFLVARSSGVRTDGETITGADQDLTTRDQLVRAAGLDAEGEALEAIQVYDEVLEVDPNNLEALTYRAWILVRAGLFDEAQPYFDQAFAADATYPDVYAFQAVSYSRQCLVDEARSTIEDFRALEPPEEMLALVESLESGLTDEATCLAEASAGSTASTTTLGAGG